MTDRKQSWQQGLDISYPVAAGVIIEMGKMVCANASGYAVPAADTAGLKLLGVAQETVDNSAGANDDLNVVVRRKGVFDFAATSISQAMVGKQMFVKDAETVDESSTNLVPAGELVEYLSTTRGRIAVDVGIGAAAGAVSIADAGAFTTAANVEAAIQELYQHIMTANASVVIPLTSMTLEDGTPLAKFSDGALATPGLAQISNAEQVIRYNNHATPTKVAFSVPLPDDFKATSLHSLVVLAKMSGATDTPDLEVECYLNDAGQNIGVDVEIDGGTTIAAYTAGPQGPIINLPVAGMNTLTGVFGPKAGELGTDDLLIYGVKLNYTRKLMTS